MGRVLLCSAACVVPDDESGLVLATTIWLTHGYDGNCAFATGYSVTCSNSHITNVQFVENGSCPRQRD